MGHTACAMFHSGESTMLEVKLFQDKGIAVLSPQGKLKASDFASVAAKVDPYIAAHGKLNGLMINAEAFPGWSDFAAFVTHIRFVKDHHLSIKNIAVVSDSEILKIMPAVAKHFVAAKIRHYPSDQKDAALAWLESDS
jgi:SpoIIAA-like